MVKCLLWLEFEVRKLDLSGEDFGICFCRGFSISASRERTERVEIYELQKFPIPVLLAVGEWRGEKWDLSSKHDDAYLLDKIDSTFEKCFTPYRWIS